MPEQYSQSSDGRTDVYTSPSGMVGAGNANQCWALWKPQPGIRYKSAYLGHTIETQASDYDAYWVSIDGATPSLRRYDSRWLTGRFYDASGQPIISAESAAVPGTPAQVFMTPGAQIVATTNEAATPDQWTKSSDGRTDVYVAESGMAGVVVGGVWAMFVPPAGVTISSHFNGHTVTVKNNGDGTYQLESTASGVNSRRAYDSRWLTSAWYSSTGVGATTRDAALAMGSAQVSNAYYTPGRVVATASVQATPTPVVTQTPTQTPAPNTPQIVTPQVMTPAVVTPLPQTVAMPYSGGGGSTTTYTPAGNLPANYVPGSTDTRTDTHIDTSASSGGMSTGVKLAIAAAAALALFNN